VCVVKRAVLVAALALACRTRSEPTHDARPPTITPVARVLDVVIAAPSPQARCAELLSPTMLSPLRLDDGRTYLREPLPLRLRRDCRALLAGVVTLGGTAIADCERELRADRERARGMTRVWIDRPHACRFDTDATMTRDAEFERAIDQALLSRRDAIGRCDLGAHDAGAVSAFVFFALDSNGTTTPDTVRADATFSGDVRCLATALATGSWPSGHAALVRFGLDAGFRAN
jgi:hypothetical protein